MARLFNYDSALLIGIGTGTNVADQAQVLTLQNHGFIPLYNTARAKELHRFGMLMAHTYTDGALRLDAL